MSTPASPSNPKSTGDDRNLVSVDATTAASFEDKVQGFWQKNRGAIFGVCAVILVAILAKYGWEHRSREKDLDVQKAYAATTSTEQLKGFAAAHEGHPLAGVAQLRIADEAYAAGKAADAQAAYEKAVAALADGPLKARALLGRALAKAQAGNKAQATTELQQIANDAKQFKGVRAEAAYHLASLAVEAGNAADVQKYSDQLMQIDPQSPWTGRAMSLRASLPVTAAPAPAATAPAAPAKKDDASSGMQIKLPGK